MRKKTAALYTFSDTLDNYGQVLQCLSTQLFFEQLGYDVSVIRYNPQKKEIPTSLLGKIRRGIHNKLFTLSQRIKKSDTKSLLDISSEAKQRSEFYRITSRITTETEEKYPRGFEDFRQRNFQFFDTGDLFVAPPKADLMIAGSDQVWSYITPLSFVQFGGWRTKRVSFASSFGSTNPLEHPRFSTFLKTFDIVTVRESQGLEYCNKAGRKDTMLIPDPTLLHSKDVYEKYEEKNFAPSEDYILLYLLGNPIDIDIPSIYTFAESQGLSVVYVPAQGREDEFPKCYATIPQWLNLVHNAKYVFTNSYHGVAFSIIYERQFTVFPLLSPFEKTNERIYTLLTMLDLKDRIFRGELIDNYKLTIDYATVIELLSKKRKNVQSLFKKKI